MPRILIDADGCPVVDTTVRLAREFHTECILLSDTSHRFQIDGVQTITVSKGADSVDFALVNLLHPGDIVITQDYGLAAMCLSRNGRPINQDGMRYTDDNISALLDARYAAKKHRMSGGRLKGHPKRTAAQTRQFEAALRKMLSE